MAGAVSRGLLLAPLAGATRLASHRGSMPPFTTTPAAPESNGPYEPADLLCRRGDKVEDWCVQWLACIRQNAQPTTNKASVRKAWSPASCKEYCGVWPVTSGVEGSVSTASVTTTGAPGLMTWGGGGGDSPTSPKPFMTTTPAPVLPWGLLQQHAGDRGDCEKSCANFQDSLSGCVATILFEPGKVEAMMPDSNKPTYNDPVICKLSNTPCMPDLPFQYQQCISHRANKVLGKNVSKETEMHCEKVKSDFDDCKDCPQLSPDYTSTYHSFVGGCMDQLNAYWAATHPKASEVAVIPGAGGCQVH